MIDKQSMKMGVQRRRHYAPQRGEWVDARFSHDYNIWYTPPGGWDHGTYTCTATHANLDGSFDHITCGVAAEGSSYTFHMSDVISTLPPSWFTPQHTVIPHFQIYDRAPVRRLRVVFSFAYPDLVLGTSGCGLDYDAGGFYLARCGPYQYPTGFSVTPSPAYKFRAISLSDANSDWNTETPDPSTPIISSPWYTPLFPNPIVDSLVVPGWFGFSGAEADVVGNVVGDFINYDGTDKFLRSELNDMELTFELDGPSRVFTGWQMYFTVYGYYSYRSIPLH